MQRRYYPRQKTWEVFTMAVTNSHSPYGHVLELLYTYNLRYEVQQLWEFSAFLTSS